MDGPPVSPGGERGPRGSPGTGRGGGAHREPVVKVAPPRAARVGSRVVAGMGGGPSCAPGIPIRITADLSVQTLQARREWQDILKVMKEKNLQPRLLYPARISSKYEGKSKALQTSKS